MRKFIVFALFVLASIQVFANSRYEQVEALSDKLKQSVFRSVVGSAGEGCGTPDTIKAMGVNDQGEGRWTVQCSNGQSYLVRVHNDAKGTLTASNCADEEISEPCAEKNVEQVDTEE